MKNNIIDLRSDTVTKPSREMLASITSLEYGDLYYNNDSTTMQLEQQASKMFGFQSSIFVISGTIANILAVKTLTDQRHQMLTDANYHINYFTGHSIAALSSIKVNQLHTDDGIILPKHIATHLETNHQSSYQPTLGLICVENSINYFSGKIFPYNQLKSVYQFAKKSNLNVYLDGARIFNAAAAEETPLNHYSKVCDMMMFSLSKSLGCPSGALILGSSEHIAKIHYLIKLHGCGLHQGSILSGCGLYAITHNLHNPGEDNIKAREMYRQLQELAINGLEIYPVETNIVMVSTKQLNLTSHDFAKLLAQHGILAFDWSKHVTRFVFHADIAYEDIRKVKHVIAKLLTSMSRVKRISQIAYNQVSLLQTNI